jgi:DNA-binding NtrC family response regulator
MAEMDILVVEDDDLQRKALFGKLTAWGYATQACDSLVDARRRLDKQSFDLILLDMRLPDGDGLDFLRERKPSDEGGESVVMMTAFADVATAVAAIKEGAYDYLPKPFEDDQLRKILRNTGDRVDLNQRVAGLSRMTLGGAKDVWQLDDMIGAAGLRDIFEKAQRLAAFSETTVLILGESGTGKGMLAKAIHKLSARADKPFVDINCSAIPAQLIESEVFGYEKGAFTDAKNGKPGLLEIAHGGTAFLDEIGDMELNLQGKLLKVIEDKAFRRLGSSKTTSVDIRIVAATSRNLKEMVAAGTFREDLYYRLSVVPITMPPLREHRESILPLAEHYLRHFSREMGRFFQGFAPDALAALTRYAWPGNIRELRNAVERGSILATGEHIGAEALALPQAENQAVASADATDTAADSFSPMTLAEGEKRLIRSVLTSVDGNKNKAAEILAVHRTTLYKKIAEYGLE